MNSTIKVKGIILSNTNIGDFDKRIVILTRERGKISVFVRGARRVKSKFISSINPFTFGDFYLFVGNDYFSLCSVEVIERFEYFSTHLESAYMGYYFLEFSNVHTIENNNERNILRLLYMSLEALRSEKIPLPLIKRIFEIKFICILGETPNFLECCICGEKNGEFYFDIKKRSVICSKHRSNMNNSEMIKLQPSSLYAIRFIINSSLDKLYSFTLTDEAFHNFVEVIDRIVSVYYSGNYLSLEILKELKIIN